MEDEVVHGQGLNRNLEPQARIACRRQTTDVQYDKLRFLFGGVPFQTCSPMPRATISEAIGVINPDSNTNESMRKTDARTSVENKLDP